MLSLLTALRLTGAHVYVNSASILLFVGQKTNPAADGEVRPSWSALLGYGTCQSRWKGKHNQKQRFW